MADRATVRQIVNLGMEVTSGTTVAATKRMQGLQLDSTIKTTASPFRAMGQKYNSVVEINQEWVEAKVSGDALYGEIIYLLSSLFGKPSPAQNGSASNLGYSWTFDPSTSSEDVPQTFTIEQGDAVRAHKFGYGLCTDLTLAWDRTKAVTQSGTIIGQRLTDAITLTPVVDNVWSLSITGTPTGGTFTITAVVNGSTQTTAAIAYNATSAAVQSALAALTNIGSSNVAVTGTTLPSGTQTITFQGQLAGQTVTLTKTDSLTGGTSPASAVTQTTAGSGPATIPVAPVLPTQIDVYIDSSAAGLGSTQMTRVFSSELAIGTKFAPIWTLDSSNNSFAAHIEKAPKATAKILMEADAQGMGLLTTMRPNSTQFMRFLATGTQIDSSPAFDYKMQVDMAVQVSAPEQFKDQDGVYAIGWGFELVNDDPWGKAMEIIVNCERSAL
ncbi:MAG: hypothetical protein KGL39_22740 [Patescibacteria group bacterium]|nr:hypothetical protein [Patescibacteria group bacterium]